MGLFDKFLKLSFDDAVNKLLSNKAGPSEEERIKQGLLNADMTTTRYYAPNALRVYRYKTKDPQERIDETYYQMREAVCNLFPSVISGNKALVDQCIRHRHEDGTFISELCLQEGLKRVEKSPANVRDCIFMAYVYINGYGTKVDMRKARKMLDKLDTAISTEYEADWLKDTTAELEQMIK